MPRIVVKACVGVWIAIFAVLLPGMWIWLAVEEGWSAFMLQTEKSRAAYLTSMWVVLGSTVLLALVLIMAGRRQRGEPSSSRSSSSTSSSSQSSSYSDSGGGGGLLVRAEALGSLAFGVGGLFLEFRKSPEHRVWWVMAVWGVVAVGSLIEFLASRRS